MRTEMHALGALLLVFSTGGCSSVSLPGLPAPWSTSAPVADPTAEALFQEGNRYFQEKRYVRALDAFTKLKTEHPFSPLVTEAELKVADAYFLNEQYVEAVNAFKEFQSLHPASEHIPFVVLRLGQAHFNQFTDINRDQKNTEIAKGYFEAVLANYSNSPYAAEAREKLAKSNGILAEHEFNIAEFYFKQKKFPAARDRFEEIVRKYPGTPIASRSLFFLGESYRQEKNNVKAALAYEALLEHYPNDPLAGAARTQLAQIEKSKHDPLAMLLMRDRRPLVIAETAEAKPEAKSTAKVKEPQNLVAKTEVVYEAPGVEKGLFSRVVQTINPFSASSNDKKTEVAKEEKPKSAVDLLAKNANTSNGESRGFFASLWPFGGDADKTNQTAPSANADLVASIDATLKQQGIDATPQSAAVKPPAAELPNVDDLEPKPQETTDNTQLLEQIDANLAKEGKSPTAAPAAPEAAEVFRDPEAAQAAIARSQPRKDAEQSTAASGLLSSIDQKLKSQGVEPGNFEPPPAVTQSADKPAPAPPKEINLESRIVEKGPLFLNPAQVPAIEQSATTNTPDATIEPSAKVEEPTSRELPKEVLLKGSQAPAAAAPVKQPAESTKPGAKSEEEGKGALDQLRQDFENVGKVLNPFKW
jgi:outer membrane protein assembly factor BamD